MLKIWISKIIETKIKEIKLEDKIIYGELINKAIKEHVEKVFQAYDQIAK